MGPDHKDTLSSMYQLAMAYNDQGKLSDAETLFSKLLKICKGPRGAERVTFSQGIPRHLYLIYLRRGHPQMADKADLQALEMGNPFRGSDFVP